MKCVILQPSYIPWRGYFDQVRKADLFVFYDDIQYDSRGWRNRNKIKTPQGLRWLTIPVHHKGSQTSHIPTNEIKICWETDWIHDHWKTITTNYRNAPNYDMVSSLLIEDFDRHPEYLADFTIDLTIKIARFLGFSETQFIRSSSLEGIEATKTDRLVQILEKVGADHYISGPSASDYIEEEKFISRGITLEYMTYAYPPYPQLYPPYNEGVSILDLLFMTGMNAADFF